MEMIKAQSQYSDIIVAAKTIKSAIIKSRYNTAKLINRELLTLYFNIGCYISSRSRIGHWGTGAINTLSKLLRQELPGLTGFSETNIKNMRIFYEEWATVFGNRQSITADLSSSLSIESEVIINRQLLTTDLTQFQLDCFFSVSFTHHREIIRKTSSLEERLFYITKCATEFWQVSKLKYALNERLYNKKNINHTNFTTVILNDKLRRKALDAFKDNYFFDFVNWVDDDDLIDEKVIETEIVRNIKNFIMAFGQDFTYMGNQYRLTVDGRDYFVDLLFYHRGLRCLVAVELKRGEFKAPYMGQMNLYLSALDEYVKRQDENPSIGIILCKEKSYKTVEFAFRNVSTPMGVATYTLRKELPEEYQDVLPDPEDLRNLL